MKYWLGLLAGCVFSTQLMAANTQVEQVKQRLVETIPELSDATVSTTPIPGLFAVQQGVFVFYTSADTNYIVQGELLDMENRVNLTEQAQQGYRVQVLAQIKDEDTIQFLPKQAAQQRITVFTDIDCPYCHKLHALIPQLLAENIAVRYVMYPRAGMNSPSYQKAEHAWCQRQDTRVIDGLMKGESPESYSTCQNPLEQQLVLTQILALQGTPSILLDNGELIPGLVPIEELIKAVKAQSL